jgi:glyoxylase-like metal-dependent hydrolase (beta-lactamase superfamily II)
MRSGFIFFAARVCGKSNIQGLVKALKLCRTGSAETIKAADIHEKELAAIHHPHPLDFRYLEDYIEDVEKNGQLEIIKEDQTIVPGISVMHTPAHTQGGMTVLIDTAKGRAAITGFCVIDENFNPPREIRAMEMDVIPPGTLVNAYDAYDILLKVKTAADLIIPLHEPRFAGLHTIP